MKKWILLILISFAVHAEEAVEGADPYSSTDPVTGESVLLGKDGKPRPADENPPPDYRSPVPGEDFKAGADGKNCESYIRSDGTYGPKGLMIRHEILGHGLSSDHKKYFLNHFIPKMGTLCDAYNTFSEEQMLNFWVWYVMSTAWDETQCGDPASIVNLHGTNGIATCDLQMPEARDLRNWRGKGCIPQNPSQLVQVKTGEGVNKKLRTFTSVMANPVNCMPCVVEILGGSLCGFYSHSGSDCGEPQPPFGSNMYWDKTRCENSDCTGKKTLLGDPTRRSRVMKRIKEFPLCKRR